MSMSILFFWRLTITFDDSPLLFSILEDAISETHADARTCVLLEAENH